MQEPPVREFPGSGKRCVAGFGFTAILAGILALGVVLRLAQWAHNREFWYDEAYLALDIIRKSYSALTGPLSLNMNFPMGFLLATKVAIGRLGTSEYAFRFLPLIAGILSIPLFMQLARRVESAEGSGIPDRSNAVRIGVAAALFALSKHHIYYSSELRHYAIDVLVVCALYLIALPDAAQPARARRTVYLALFGAAVVWFSLASVFVLAAIATVDIVTSVFARQWRRAVWSAGWCVPWSLSFLLHLHWLHVNIALRSVGPGLDAICASMSVPIPPTSGEDLRAWRDALEHLFAFPGGFTYVGLAGFTFLVGCIALSRNRRALLLKLLLPFAYAMIASSYHQYPFRNQYLLFLLPCIYLIIAEGIAAFFEVNTARWHVAGIVLAVVLLAQPSFHSLKVLAVPRSGPGGASVIKPLLAHVRECWQAGDILYVCGDQQITVAYYGPQYGFHPIEPGIDLAPGYPDKQAYGFSLGETSSAASENAGKNVQRCWLLYQGHAKPTQSVATGYAKIEALRSESSSLYLLSFGLRGVSDGLSR